MEGSPAIEATDVEKAYGETTALQGVSLSIDAGNVFALLGPNGSGKTTLVRCLTGTTSIDDGDASVLGEAPGAADPERLGLLPQAFDPMERLTPRELVSYYAGLYDRPRDVPAVLSDVGIDEAADRRYESLSGGQRRRTLVGTAVVNDPEVLFLDEPTTGIDPAGRRAVWGLIEDLAAGGTTVFLTTHDLAEVDRLADRVGILQEGELLAADSPGGLVAAHGGEPELVVSTDAAGVSDYETEPTGGGLRLHGVSRGEIGDVVATLQREGIDFDGLAWREPDLESVYLDLTGREEPSPTDGGEPR